MQPKIIAFSGAHGTGKTTSVYAMAEWLKRKGKNVGIILETARDCPLPVLNKACNKSSEDSQVWIFSAQLKREIEAIHRYDIVVSDRTLVDCIAYTRYLGYQGLAYSMRLMASDISSRYLKVFFKKISENDFLIDDGFRATDPDERLIIESIMLSEYLSLKFEVDYQDLKK